MNDVQVQKINVRNLADLCGCFHALVWNDLEEPIQPLEVLRVIGEQNPNLLNPFSEPPPDSSTIWSREDHVQRIGWFVENGWDDPITLDFRSMDPMRTVSSDQFWCGWPVADGLHRVAAAVVRLDDYIEARIEGSLKHHSELLDTSCVRLDEIQLTEKALLKGMDEGLYFSDLELA